MHVRVRMFGKPETVVVVESKLTKIDHLRKIIRVKFDVEPKLQRLVYGGKLLENGYTFHDYNIKLNDVIQLMVKVLPDKRKETNAKSKRVDKALVYTDAPSKLYEVGDLVDARDVNLGFWEEGKILRIVLDPSKTILQQPENLKSFSPIENKTSSAKESDLENKFPVKASPDNKSKKKGIVKYFPKSPKTVNKKSCDGQNSTSNDKYNIDDSSLLYKIQLEDDAIDSNLYCSLADIRPRARSTINVKDLKNGQTVMINHNPNEPSEKGFWYDFKVDEVNKRRSSYELVGTIYIGAGAVPQNDTKIRVHDKIFLIEKVVPLEERTEADRKNMTTAPEKRSPPLKCMACRDDEDTPCKECGCFICSGKDFPGKIVLCDDCDNGYHMHCLSPPLKELPEEDWYCPSCKRDPNAVIAPGAGKQIKKTASTSKGNRDWGRGMACAGKTKTCAMPPNHFGPIPGIEVGMCWRFRIQLSESGVHRPPVSGIHGRDVEGAYSIVLSGGYEDDVDRGEEFTYTGSGGRDLSGNKRTAEQSCDQTLTRENKALARNCAVKEITEKGGDAGDDWRKGKPVRVVRSYKMIKHFPKYAPKEGIRYDGIYKVVKYYPEKGLSGFRVWKYLLRRDDPSPAPWAPAAKKYPIVYPDGYLEAEAEKKALKEKTAKTDKGAKKRTLKEKTQSIESDSESSPPSKKRKTRQSNRISKGTPHKDKETPKKTANIFNMKSPKNKSRKTEDSKLSTEEVDAIKADTLNAKLWEECLEVSRTKGKKEFIEHMTETFLCIICQDVAANPVTTPCLHNFCMACIKLAFKTTDSQICPCCRNGLDKYKPKTNEELKTALRSILAGYDSGKK